MRSRTNIHFYPVAFLIIFLVFTGCKKDSYITDGGVHNENTNLSTYDYLNAHAYHYFDTTILLIDHFNLKDSVNKSGTFFAFTDFAVERFMQDNHYDNLDSLYAHTSSKFITQYLFSDNNITLENASLTPVEYPNWAGTLAPSAVKKNQGVYNVDLSSSSPAFNYFVLYYTKINGVLDESPNRPPDDKLDASVACQTSGIKTATGTTLHVLANTASLNKL